MHEDDNNLYIYKIWHEGMTDLFWSQTVPDCVMPDCFLSMAWSADLFRFLLANFVSHSLAHFLFHDGALFLVLNLAAFNRYMFALLTFHLGCFQADIIPVRVWLVYNLIRLEPEGRSMGTHDKGRIGKDINCLVAFLTA